MPFYNTFKRRGMLRLVEDLLRAKFGKEGIALAPAIRDLDDGELCLDLNRAIAMAEGLDEVRLAVARASAMQRWPRGMENGKREFWSPYDPLD
jgi:hypothetical protein